MARPRLLDLFCGAGGAAMGYYRAGFDVVGVDLKPQPHYPFEFHQGDAMTWSLDGFDVIHASPPCQAYSITRNAHTVEHPELVDGTRDRLAASGIPYVIENVVGAPMRDPMTLCGSMFGLRAWDHYIGQMVQLKRHRLFESPVLLMPPGPCEHVKGMRIGGVYGGAWSKNASVDPAVKRTGGYAPPDDVQRNLMGFVAPRKGLAQAIPPAYTEWIGAQLLRAL
jgi:DNA (cytosine-5)-methyltransferase 1